MSALTLLRNLLRSWSQAGPPRGWRQLAQQQETSLDWMPGVGRTLTTLRPNLFVESQGEIRFNGLGLQIDACEEPVSMYSEGSTRTRICVAHASDLMPSWLGVRVTLNTARLERTGPRFGLPMGWQVDGLQPPKAAGFRAAGDPVAAEQRRVAQLLLSPALAELLPELGDWTELWVRRRKVELSWLGWKASAPTVSQVVDYFASLRAARGRQPA